MFKLTILHNIQGGVKASTIMPSHSPQSDLCPLSLVHVEVGSMVVCLPTKENSEPELIFIKHIQNSLEAQHFFGLAKNR